MQIGTIVYLADAKAPSGELEPEAAAAAGGLPPAWTRVVASAAGYEDVPDALLDLVRRGAGRVDLLAAQRDATGLLHLGSRRLRLHG